MITGFQFFKQPFPFFQKKWQLVMICAVSVSIVQTSMFVGIGPVVFSIFVLNVVGYTIVTAICSSIVVYIFPILFKRFFDEKQWTKGKYFLFAFAIILTVAVANTLYAYYFIRIIFYPEIDDISFSTVLNHFLTVTPIIGIIPTLLGYFWLKNQGLNSDLHEKEDQNRKLAGRIRKENMPDEKIITLSGNTKDTLTLFPHELLYMESVGNYVRIHYQLNGQISQKMLRATLQQMEELLCDYPFFVRCHRAFIVNTQQIEKIKGSHLWLKPAGMSIPVSKTYKKEIVSKEHQ